MNKGNEPRSAVPLSRADPIRIGSYLLSDRLGQGGMGEVYRCTRADGPAEYAIKLLSAALVKREDEHRAFLRECQTLKRLEHPHILSVLDYGIHDGLPYLVTELCTDREGRPFSLGGLQRSRTSHRLDAYTITEVFPQVCWALAYIHQMGLVHRDIKPENVLLRADSIGKLTAKLGDFGLAGLTVDASYIWTKTWVTPEETQSDDDASGGAGFTGTYDYMSPEQQAAEPVDARSDVYSLGVMLYRLATGYDRLTFRKPSQVVEDLPTWVDDVVVKCVVQEKAARLDNALEVLFLLPENLRPAGIERGG
jgi:serine/threonine protein kinase